MQSRMERAQSWSDRVARLLLVVAFAALSGSAVAQPLSCERFKSKLASAIHEGGDLVAQPWGWSINKGDDTREDFRGVVGLYGSVQCIAGRFFAFGATAIVGSADKRENADRHARLIALGAASICALEAAMPKTCASSAHQMHDEATKELAASKHRGDESAAGVGQRDLTRTDTAAQIDAADNNTVSFSLNIAPKDSIEDLTR